MDKLTLNTIGDPKSRSEKKRVGRGTGSGVGKTAEEVIRVKNQDPEEM